MNREQPQMDLDSLDLSGNVTLAVGWRVRGSIGLGRLEISPSIAQHFREVCESHLDGLRRKTPKLYYPDIDLEQATEYLYLPLDNLDRANPVLLAHEGVHLRDSITLRSLPKRSLLFYSVIFHNGPTFIRKLNAYQSLNPGKLHTRLQDTLTEIEDPVFTFDERFDLIVSEDALAISNVRAFELLFRSDEVLTIHVRAYISHIASFVPLASTSIDAIEAECLRSVRLRRRLESLYRSEYLPDIRLEDVGSVATASGLVPASLIRDGHLHIAEADVEDALILLNDDFFTGGLSGIRFVADKKARR